MIAIWQSMTSRVDCLLHPAYCLLCSVYHENSMPWLCAECGQKIAVECHVQSRCMPLGHEVDERLESYCGWLLDETIRFLIHQLKYEKHKRIGAYLGDMMAEKIAARDFFSPENVIVPVPLHNKRLRERGFNQSEQIANGLALALGNPVETRCLNRSVHTAQQVHLDREERQQNVAGAFSFNPKSKDVIANKHVTLVDDVLTTGATLRECALTLYEAGAAKVSAVTLAFSQL